MYFFVFLIQIPSKIFGTLANETVDEKILKIFVCEELFSILIFSG